MTASPEHAPPPHEPPFVVPYLRDPRFIGRDDELARLHASLRASTPVGLRAAIDMGSGGAGVTQLAVEYAYRHRSDYPGGVYWLTAEEDRRGRRDLYAAYDVLARRMGLYAAPPSPRWRFAYGAGLQSLAEHLRDKPAALLIYEDIDGPDAIIAPDPRGRAQALPGRALFTTRRRDPSMRGESVAVSTLPEDAAVALVRGAASASGPRDEGAPEGEAARSLCRALGLLPLALALAASYLRAHPEVSVDAYLGRLAEGGGLAVPGPRDDITLCLSERHEAAVSATLRAHWEALESPAARHLLSTLALLRCGAHVPRRRLEILTGLPAEGGSVALSPLDEALADLVARGLVEELAERAFRLHPLVRAFVRERIDDPGALAGRGAARAADLLRDPERFEREVYARGATDVMLDLAAGGDLGEQAGDPLATRATFYDLRGILETAGPVGWERARLPGMLLGHARDYALFELRDSELAALAEARLSERRLPYLATRAGPPSSRGGRRGATADVAVTSDGRCAISTSTDGSITFWELPSCRLMHTLRPSREPMVRPPVIAGDGLVGLFASMKLGGPLTVWDLTSDRAAVVLKGRRHEQTENLAISRSGRFAAAVTNGGAVTAWDLTRPGEARVRVFKEDVGATPVTDREAQSLAVTDDGRVVIIAMADGTLALWDVHDDRVTRTSGGHLGAVTSILVMPDGRRALTASEDGSLTIWDIGTGALRRALGATVDCVRTRGRMRQFGSSRRAIISAALTADGRFAVGVTASREVDAGGPRDDDSLTVWDLATGQVVVKLPRWRARSRGVRCAITPDRATIVLTGGAELTVVEWVRGEEG